MIETAFVTQERSELYHNDRGFQDARRQTLMRQNARAVDVEFVLDVDVVSEDSAALDASLRRAGRTNEV